MWAVNIMHIKDFSKHLKLLPQIKFWGQGPTIILPLSWWNMHCIISLYLMSNRNLMLSFSFRIKSILKPRWFSCLSVLLYPKNHAYALTLDNSEKKIEAQNLAVFARWKNNDNKYSIQRKEMFAIQLLLTGTAGEMLVYKVRI